MIHFQIGDLVRWKKRYCVVTEITDGPGQYEKVWGAWRDSAKSAQAKSLGTIRTYMHAQKIEEIITPAKRTIKDYLEGKKND